MCAYHLLDHLYDGFSCNLNSFKFPPSSLDHCTEATKTTSGGIRIACSVEVAISVGGSSLTNPVDYLAIWIMIHLILKPSATTRCETARRINVFFNGITPCIARSAEWINFWITLIWCRHTTPCGMGIHSSLLLLSVVWSRKNSC